MPFNVTLMPSEHSFEVPDGQCVLNAGLAAGWHMPYSCRTGVCRTCRGRMLEGRVDLGNVHPTYLAEEHRAVGLAMLCQAQPKSNLVIQLKEPSLPGVKPTIAPCRANRIDRPAPDVAVIDLKLPMNEN